MTPDRGFFHLPRNWRVREEWLRLSGKECLNCGTKIFPSKHICPNCKYEVEGTFLTMGVVKLTLEHTNNGSKPRDVEFNVSFIEKGVEIAINLNGKSHTIGLKAGMKVPVFVIKSLNGEESKYIPDINQPVSEAIQDQGSSKSSK